MDGVRGPVGNSFQGRDGGFQHGLGHFGIGLGLLIGEELYAVVRQRVEEVNLFGDLRQLFTPGLEQGGDPVMRDQHNKMSKRHGDPSYEDLKAQGYLTDAILNYVALLGWSPRGDIAEQEVFSLQELAKAFDLAGMSKSPAIFDIEKLTHFNAIYLRAMAPEAFADVARPYIRQAVQREDISADDIAALLQARCEKLTDIPEKVDFFQALPEYDAELFTNKKSKTNPEVSKRMLEAAIPMLRQLPDWTQDAIHDGLVDLAAKLEVKNATLMWPVRIAAAGKAVTPGGAVEICRILGREETLKRLELGLEKLK